LQYFTFRIEKFATYAELWEFIVMFIVW